MNQTCECHHPLEDHARCGDLGNYWCDKCNCIDFSLVPTATLIASCDGSRIPYNDDTPAFIDIASDFEGRDVLTFECPKCGHDHKSLVYG